MSLPSTRGSGLSKIGSGAPRRGSGVSAISSSSSSSNSAISPSPIPVQRPSPLQQASPENLFSLIRIPIEAPYPLNVTDTLPQLPFVVENVHSSSSGFKCDANLFCDIDQIQHATEEVQLIKLDGGITVLQDRVFPYGAKIRGHRAMQTIKNMGKEGVVASGTSYGMGQVALAAACRMYGLRCKIFLTDDNETEMTYKSRQLGADIVMNKLRLHQAKDASIMFARSSNDTYYWMEPGLADPIFMDALTENMKLVKQKYKLNPTEIWVAGGTGTFASCLTHAFPEITIHIVRVGLTLWEDLFTSKNYKIHEYTKSGFYIDYPHPVPYESLRNYDAKVWDFRPQMKPGALIWNIY